MDEQLFFFLVNTNCVRLPINSSCIWSKKIEVKVVIIIIIIILSFLETTSQLGAKSAQMSGIDS